MNTLTSTSFDDWWTKVEAEAKRRGVSHLLGRKPAHRVGYDEGLSPIDEVQAQIDSIDDAEVA